MNYWKQDDRDDEAIVLIDPDFLFLNKFELPKNAHPVLPGKPAAAKYGLGGQVGIKIYQCCYFTYVYRSYLFASYIQLTALPSSNSSWIST